MCSLNLKHPPTPRSALVVSMANLSLVEPEPGMVIFLNDFQTFFTRALDNDAWIDDAGTSLEVE